MAKVTPTNTNPHSAPATEREHMIAEAAYYLAEKRGFAGTEPEALEDWLAAEREIDSLHEGLSTPH